MLINAYIEQYLKRRTTLKARNLVISDIDSLVLIYDHMNMLVDFNKDAERFHKALMLREDIHTDPDKSLDGGEIYLPETGEYYSINEKRLYDNKGRFTGRVVVFINITGLKTTINELEHITSHDYLTGLYNRQTFHHELRMLRDPDLPAVLVYVNISGMKLINNIYGNEYGDKVIIRAAVEISRTAGRIGKCSCARLNGDEIGVIIRNAGKLEAESFISEITKNLSENAGDKSGINLRTDYVILPDTGHNAEQLFTSVAESMHKNSEHHTGSLSQGFINSLQDSLKTLYEKTGYRSQRITELCSRVADRLSLSIWEKDKLKLLSVMADVGLLSASPSLLQNKGNLTNEQWEEMKLHTIKGHNIALSISELSEIAQEILSHHERYDGYGYPIGIKGNDIPMLSRIYAAVEFFTDAPGEHASSMLRARRGTQFDPAVTDAILEMS